MIEWNKSMSVGIKEFDTHHRRIIDHINELSGSLATANAGKVAEEALTELSNYCAYHFLAEESAMAIYKVPELAAHKEEHRMFIDKLFQLTGHMQTNKECVPRELLDFLWEWLSKHILETDKKYTVALRAAGMD